MLALTGSRPDDDRAHGRNGNTDEFRHARMNALNERSHRENGDRLERHKRRSGRKRGSGETLQIPCEMTRKENPRCARAKDVGTLRVTPRTNHRSPVEEHERESRKTRTAARHREGMNRDDHFCDGPARGEDCRRDGHEPKLPRRR